MILRKHFSLLLCCLFALTTQATHITGGSITYKHLGGNTYEINLEVLRDCFGGIPFFDNPASLGIYHNGQLYDEVLISLIEPVDTISTLQENTICIYPESICIDRAMYTTTVTLGNGKYDLAYQRCCFSEQLANIIDPLNNGFTLSTTIDSDIPNSSPVFQTEIPVTTFINIPFVHDASVTDIDGDSLVYRLNMPKLGGTYSDPLPMPPSGPPYDPVSFILPTFSVTNMLGGSYPLTIDPHLGEMTAIPTYVGLYLVSYVVEEYRDGQMIGSSERLFTFYTTPIDQGVNFNVNGTVKIDDQTPLDAGTIQLLQRDITTDSLDWVDEKVINANGSYAFQDISPGVYYLRAFPDPQSIYFDDYLPTYYRSDLLWYNANAITQCDTSEFYRDVFLVPVGGAPEGDANLGGYIYHETSGLPANQVGILLLDELEETLAHTTTNSQGYFEFPNLAPDNYLLYVDLLNSGIDNENPPFITLTENQTYDFILYDNLLEVDGLTALEPTLDHATFQVAPNPSSGIINIHFELAVAESSLKMEVFNILGELELSQSLSTQVGQHREELNLSSGVHFVVLTNSQGQKATKKVIVY